MNFVDRIQEFQRFCREAKRPVPRITVAVSENYARRILGVPKGHAVEYGGTPLRCIGSKAWRTRQAETERERGGVDVNGPNPICAGCGEPMKVWGKPICDDCLIATGVEPVEFCALCETGLKTDKHGLHLTKAGGYAGKCTAFTSNEQSK